MLAPLSDVRVLDASTYLLGPVAAMMLADLGAEVIKVEPPDGDPYRRVGPRHAGTGLQAAVVNRNKRSVALDLKDRCDRVRFLALVRSADVVVHNWRPGVGQRLHLDDAMLADTNPRLIRLWVTGYGPDGPLADRPAFDSLLQAQTGLTCLQGHPGDPETVRTYLADKVTAAFAVQAVLAALLEREHTGAGRLVSLSMLEALAYFNFPDVCLHRLRCGDGGEAVPPPSTLVPTADGHVVVSPVSGRQVRAAIAAVGDPGACAELEARKDWAALAGRLVEVLARSTKRLTTARCLELFAAADVPAAPVLSPDQHLSDPQVHHLGIYGHLDDDTLGRVRYARYPGGLRTTRPAPSIGQHNSEVLDELISS